MRVTQPMSTRRDQYPRSGPKSIPSDWSDRSLYPGRDHSRSEDATGIEPRVSHQMTDASSLVEGGLGGRQGAAPPSPYRLFMPACSETHTERYI